MSSGDQSVARAQEFLRRHEIALLTMLFTDIVGSTGLKQELGDQAAIQFIQRHHALVRDLLAQFPGAEEIGTAGDSFFLVFVKPSDAARFALKLQGALRRLSREAGQEIKIRIGIHVGEVFARTEGEGARELFGMQIDTAARVMGLGDGDQILLSRFAFDSARQVLRGSREDGLGELSWLNHGYYSLKGVEEPVEVCEVGETGVAVLRPPGDSSKAHRFHAESEEPVLGWRPAPGQLVPNTRWRLDLPLGEGGFGEVWLARHEELKQERVFKFCFNAERARSLKREVTLFRVLRERVGSHPNIVGIHDVFFDQPPYYVVMEYVEGSSLAEWPGANTAPLASKLEIVAQIADALQAAHDAGVIHRDVKPGNILLCEKKGAPHAMLSDFGIGQVVSAEALAGVTSLGFTETMITPGSSAGTQIYMAPELIAGRPATIRSDIYALGVIIYQLALGDLQKPLTSDWAEDIEDPLLRDDIRSCVAGDPAKRFAGAAQVAANLRQLPQRQAALADEQARIAAIARSAYRRGVIRAASISVIIIAVVATLGVVSFIQYRRAEISSQRASHARNEAEKLIEFMGVDLRDKLKPIGRLELLDSANQRVRAYYRSFTDGGKDRGILSRQSTAFLNEGMILRDRGDQAGALKSFQEAHALRERLAREEPQNRDHQADLATSLDWIGHTLRRQGSVTGALDAYRKSFDIRQRLASGAPSEERWQRELATSCMNIGDALISSGDLNAARDAYGRSLAIAEQHAERSPADTNWQHDLVTTLISVGDVLSSQNELDGAKTAFERGLAVQQKLLASDPRNALWQRDLSVCLENVGDIMDAQGDHSGARQKYEEALVVHKRLAAQDPSNAVWQGELFVSYTKVGDALVAQGDTAGALQRFRDGLTLAEAVAEQDPTNSSAQRSLAVALERVGETLRRQRDLPEALNYVNRSLTMRRQLAQSDPENAEMQRDLFVGLILVGDVLMLQPELAGAFQHYQEANLIAQKLSSLDLTNVDWQRDLAEANDKLGQAFEQRKDAGAALPLYRAAVAAYEKLAASEGADVSDRVNLAASSFHLARLLKSAKLANSTQEANEAAQRARRVIAELRNDSTSLAKQDAEVVDQVVAEMNVLTP